jgi:WD repeat-containing protein 44
MRGMPPASVPPTPVTLVRSSSFPRSLRSARLHQIHPSPRNSHRPCSPPHLPAWRPCCSPPWKGRVHKRQGCAPARPRTTAAALDVWTSEPASVQERRRKLLQMLGLAGDPALARLEMGRSVSYDDGPVPVRPAPASLPISRSRSDGGAVPALATKPPLGGRSPGSSEATPEGEEEEEADPRCLIRNLDDGSEFVVKEGSELREVGTGRQLTMEEFVDLCVGRSSIVQELMRRENVASSGSSTPVQRSNSDSSNGATRHRRRRRHSSWLRGIRNVADSVVASSRDRRSSDDKDTCSEKGGRRSSSATDDSQDSAGAVRHGPVRVKVRQYGKSYKEFI